MLRSFLLTLFIFLSFTSLVSANVLTPDQRSWLTSHKNTLLVRPERNYPPFSFLSSSTSARPKGLAVDYLDLVAKKVGAVATFLEPRSRSAILSDIKSGKEGIVLAISESADRSDYMYFSEPFISLPAVIVTRKDFKHSKDLTLADFEAKQVAVTGGYEAFDYIKDNYPKIILESVSDDEVALQKLLLGEVDAAVMDLASLSYYTSKDVLSYVSVGGQTGFEYNLSFAVPKTMPEMVTILNAGLKEITPTEKIIISDRWITFEENREDKTQKVFGILQSPLWISVSILAIVIIIVLLTLIIVHSRRHHRYHLASLKRTQELAELKNELSRLEGASDTLEQNLEEIDSLKRAVEEKIEHIN